MPPPANNFALDAAERIIATTAEIGISAGVVALSGISGWWVAPLTIVLAGVKTLLAKFVGDPTSAGIR